MYQQYYVSCTEPKLVEFPEDAYVIEGQEVLFKVKVTGDPQPKLKWFHDGEELAEDYSTELADDGSLVIPCAETKHSGAYKLVAVSWAGRCEREVKLYVRMKGEPCPLEAMRTFTFSPIPVEQFGVYVATGHANGNCDFKDQYIVSIICEVMSIHLCLHSYACRYWTRMLDIP